MSEHSMTEGRNMIPQAPKTAFLRPGPFGTVAAADTRRLEFDLKNEAILFRNHAVDTVFIGDSITHFWELSAYFASDAGLIVNRGIGGDTTEFMVRRFGADVMGFTPIKPVITSWPIPCFPVYQMTAIPWDLPEVGTQTNNSGGIN